MALNLPSPFTIFSQELLKKVNETFWNFNNTPFSFPELSHRSSHFSKVNQQSMKVLAKYFKVPSNYQILYLPQDCGYPSVPFNLNKLTNNRSIFVVTDTQSSNAYEYAARINPQTIKIQGMKDRLSAIEKMGQSFYFYTFYNKLSLQTGQFIEQPQPLDGQILVCSLNNCSYYQQINIAKHGIVLFESGRGIGLTGSSILIVRKDLIGMHVNTCPDMLCYEKTLKTNSLINTPHTFVTLLILNQIEQNISLGYTLQHFKEALTQIKEEYTNEISKHTEVTDVPAEGLLKFKLAPNFITEQAEEFGFVQGEFLTIFLQFPNKNRAALFASKLFK